MAEHANAALKRCRNCERILARDYFYKNGGKKDGLDYKCKRCSRTRDRARADTPAGRAAQKVREAAKSSTARVARRRKDRLAHPKRFRARQLFRDAIKSGRLIRQPCERCGTEPTHGHHEDYDHPLDVVWLCSRCHGLRHRELNDHGTAASISSQFLSERT